MWGTWIQSLIGQLTLTREATVSCNWGESKKDPAEPKFKTGKKGRKSTQRNYPLTWDVSFKKKEWRAKDFFRFHV